MTGEEPVAIEFRFSKPELRRGLRALALRTMSTWAFLALSVLDLLIGMALLAVEPDGVAGRVVAGVGAVFLGSTLVALVFSPGRAISRSAMLSDQRVEFGDRIVMRYIHSEGTSDWDLFVKAAETRAFFLLFMSRKAAMILPKRAFPPGTIERFRQLVNLRLGERSRLQRPPG